MASVLGNGPKDIGSLPESILVHVFHYLPVVEICRIRRVCRNWNRIAKDSSLWRHVDTTGTRLKIARVCKFLKPNLAHIVSLKIGGPMDVNRICIQMNQFTNTMIKDLQKHCPRLESLCIQDADITRVFASSIPSTLRSLHIESCHLHARWFEELHGKSPAPNLTCLDFKRSAMLSNQDVDDICKLFPRLTSLGLDRCYRITTGIEKIATSLTELEYLDISYRGFGRDTSNPYENGPLQFNRILHLIMRNLKKLRVLRVCGLQLQDTAMGLLTDMKSVEELYMDHCSGHVSDAVFLHLSKSPNLRLLSVVGSRAVSENAVKQFKEHNPECKVIQ